MAKSHSVICKMILIVTIAIVANFLCLSADAGRVAFPSPLVVQDDDCNSTAVPWLAQCQACCTKAGHPGGYIKGDQCICNSG